MGARSVAHIVPGIPTKDGAGVRLTRVIGGPYLDHLDPFLLLDEFRSDDGADYIAGFPDHPHRGFETVTYMLAGAMRHGDHLGNTGYLTAGSAQWMTAGRGIIHSEMPEQEDGLMWGFQLWVNLPAREKMCEPRYQDIPPTEIPSVHLDTGGTVKVIAGDFAGTSGPVRDIVTRPVYLDIAVPAKAAVTVALERLHNAFVYVFEGNAEVGPKSQPVLVTRGHLAVLSPGTEVRLRADDAPTRALLVAATPLEEPIARYGPFVMNTREEIMEAVNDMRRGTFLSQKT